mmetsp:Transcript_24628/g.41645  ORF Transcript_24628/g.41645 Transcript_24628/m.41645 type:complete len:329 (+) Transcript_24628:450-1436(+)
MKSDLGASVTMSTTQNIPSSEPTSSCAPFLGGSSMSNLSKQNVCIRFFSLLSMRLIGSEDSCVSWMAEVSARSLSLSPPPESGRCKVYTSPPRAPLPLSTATPPRRCCCTNMQSTAVTQQSCSIPPPSTLHTGVCSQLSVSTRTTTPLLQPTAINCPEGDHCTHVMLRPGNGTRPRVAADRSVDDGPPAERGSGRPVRPYMSHTTSCWPSVRRSEAGECTVQNKRPCGHMSSRSAARLRAEGGRKRSLTRSGSDTARAEAGRCVKELALTPSLSREGKRHMYTPSLLPTTRVFERGLQATLLTGRAGVAMGVSQCPPPSCWSCPDENT